MANLEEQRKKLLRAEITNRTMEYLIGLTGKKQKALELLAKKSAKKIVNVYSDAIKEQQKKVLKATAKKEQDAIALEPAEPISFAKNSIF